MYVVHPVYDLLDPLQVNKLTDWEHNEIDLEFPYGGPYDNLATIIPKSRKIVDFGCYMGLQAVHFTGHAGYIGIDHIPVEHRYETNNSRHYQVDIRAVCENPTKYGIDVTKDFAICCWVPDIEAVTLVKTTFKDCFVIYPKDGDITFSKEKS